MKFKTAHINVKNGREGYGLHRDGALTWKTTTTMAGHTSCYDVVQHDSIAAAKAVFGVVTCVG